MGLGVSSFNLEAYSNSDYAGANLDRKSTTGGCQFLGRRLISWQCKKQTIVATSTTEAEYVAAANCCGKVLWIQNQMLDYGFNFMNTKIYIDNESTLCIVKNPVFHSKIKHIEIRHHFIRDAYEKKLIQILKIHTDDNVAELLTKAFDVNRLRATYGVELVSAASLVNTARPTLSTSRFGYYMETNKLVLPGKVGAAMHKVGAARQKFMLLVTVTTVVNDEKQIHATIDSKAVVVTKASIRSSLLLNDADGTACLTNEAIFQNLALMGYEGELNKLTFQKALFSPQWKYLIHTILHCLSSKSTSWNEFSTNIASAVICLATNQKFNFSKLIFDGMLRNLDTSKKKFLISHSKGFLKHVQERCKVSGKVTPLFDYMLVPHQAPEGEGSEQPTEPQQTPVPTQPSIGDQPLVIASSTSHDTTQNSRDSLEGTNRSKRDPVQPSHDSPLSGDHTSEKVEGGLNLEELFVLCTNLSNRVLTLETSKDAQAAEILKLKDQIKKLKRKCKPSISHHRAWLKSVKRLSMKKRLGRKESVSKQGRKNAKLEPTLDAFDDLDVDGGSAEELVSTVVPKTVSTARPDVDAARKEDKEKAKEKGVSIKDIKDSSKPIRSILTLKPLPTIDPKDKEIARQLQVDLQAEVERERQREEEASKAAIAETYDEVQAGIDADALFAAKLQQEEIEEYTIEERAKFLAETIVAQRKFRAVQRSVEIRNRPPTKSQLRNLMMTCLKNTGGYKHSQLKAKTFAEIQEAAGVHKQKIIEEPNSTNVEIKQEGHEESIKKRPGRRLKMKATKKSKRQKTDADLEEEEQLKAFLKIVPDEEGIIDMKSWRRGFQLLTGNQNSMILTDMEQSASTTESLDLMEVLEGVDLVLWGDLRIMFDANAEDELWHNQERWNLKSRDLYENCGVHTLILEDGTEIHMLAERKYPIIKETLERMLSLRLVAGTASKDAYTLLRFIQKQIDEYGSHDGGEKDL
ncbi:hypothetical protein Tco_1092860 [Tanacetum coccineum]|uniref:Uncharacterized protein n=1 Tax=Tanacetum coccineum TaxID=301880 RepID=A0ABQ5IDG9_9ASTR